MPAVLEIADVCAGYGAAQVLFDVSLRVDEGEVVALLGRNGAGKSTTLKTVAGLLRASRGAIRYGGSRIERLPPYRIARLGLGYVPEERRIFGELTVAENLEVGKQASRGGGSAWSVDRVIGLFPALAGLLGRLGGQISGGEQQMLTIARTLMGNPQLLLLDEPGEGLAPIVVERMLAALRVLKGEGLSLLLSEQNLRFAQALADRVYILETGTVRFAGSIEEFEREPTVRERYLSI